MTHLAGKQFVRFLSMLASRHVEKDAKHSTAGYSGVVPLASRRYPADLGTDHNAKIDLAAPEDRPRGRESCPHSIAIGRMDVR